MSKGSFQIKYHTTDLAHKLLFATRCFVACKLIFTVEYFLTKVTVESFHWFFVAKMGRCWLGGIFTDRGYWWGLLPAGIQEGGGRETNKTVCLLPQAVRCCWGWVHFLMGFSNVNLQAIFGFEGVLTMVTHESFLSSWSIELLPQKLFSPPGISSQSWWGLLLLLGRWDFFPPGVHGKGEVGPNVRGCPHITSAAGGGEGVRQMLTIADEGGKPNADDCWWGGLESEKNLIKWV